MQRRKALALAGASTLVLGSGLVAFAATGAGFLGFDVGAGDGVGSFTAPPVASAVQAALVGPPRDVYDPYVVDVGGRSRRASKPCGDVVTDSRQWSRTRPAPLRRRLRRGAGLGRGWRTDPPDADDCRGHAGPPDADDERSHRRRAREAFPMIGPPGSPSPHAAELPGAATRGQRRRGTVRRR